MKKLSFLLLLAGLLSWPLQGETPVRATHDFLAVEGVDYRTVLTTPPAPDSIAARGEQQLMRHLQADRTPAQAALAKYYEKLDVFKLMAPVLGDGCTAQNLPRTAAIFAQIRAEARPPIEGAKLAWNRLRPYLFDPSLQPAVERPENTSYPSGHSADSALYAVILAVVVPEHAADWQEQARLVRWSRIIGGAHYPSDTVAGQLLGEAIAREMLKSPALQAALLEVRAELAAQLLKKAA